MWPIELTARGSLSSVWPYPEDLQSGKGGGWPWRWRGDGRGVEMYDVTRQSLMSVTPWPGDVQPGKTQGGHGDVWCNWAVSYECDPWPGDVGQETFSQGRGVGEEMYDVSGWCKYIWCKRTVSYERDPWPGDVLVQLGKSGWGGGGNVWCKWVVEMYIIYIRGQSLDPWPGDICELVWPSSKVLGW